MTPDQYKEYWKNAAEHSVYIKHTETDKHFMSFGAEDVLSELKGIKSPAIALEDPEYGTFDAGSDNIMLVPKGRVLVIKKIKNGDYKQAQAAMNEMFLIAKKMEAKLINDRKKAQNGDNDEPESLIAQLDVGSIQLLPVGPVFDGWYGYLIQYTIMSPGGMYIDTADWLPGTETPFKI